MQVFYAKEDIEACLTTAFHTRYRSYRMKDVALTGILLARPEDEFVKKQILPHLEFWHYRSDYYTDFFCCGYIPVDFVDDAKPVNITIDGLKWGFSLRAFVDLSGKIEKQTGWHYSGADPYLILANAYFDGQQAHLDFRRSIRINFREAIEDKAANTPTELADAVFEFAKHVNESTTDPVWEFSDEAGIKLIKKGLKEVFLDWLPKSLKPSAKAAFQFVVHENEN